MRYVLLCLLGLGLAACQNQNATQQASPEAAVQGFFEAVRKADFELAKQYSSQPSQKNYLDIVQTALRMNSISAKYLSDTLAFRADSLKCQENQGQMRCWLCCGPEQSEMTVDMVQEQGKWKVHISEELQLF